MTSTTTHALAPKLKADREPRDRRTFWRVVLAVIAPLPMLAQGIRYVLSPIDGNASFQETVAAFQAHQSLVETLRWFDAIFEVLLIPAVIAVALAARRGAPRLTTAGLAVTGLGLLIGFPLLGGPNTPELLVATKGLDPTAMSSLYDAMAEDPMVLMAGGFFIIAIVIGLGLLGAALWRSRVVPAAFGIALMIGGTTHPFLPGHVAQGIGLFIAAVGFAGATIALLRSSNADFDLPPRPKNLPANG